MKRKSGNTPEERLTYNSWSGMVSRCRDPQNPLYPKYGGKGITVSDRWADPKQGIHNFIEDMGLRPSRNHSIDRIAGGSYEPGQCRWATREQQNRNVGLKKSNTLGYKGVSLNRKRPGQFRAEIRCNQGHVYLGTYPSVEEAAFAYDLASKELHGEYGWVNGNVQLTREQEDNVRNKVKVFIQDSLVKGV
jgi:hypothetical protein